MTAEREGPRAAGTRFDAGTATRGLPAHTVDDADHADHADHANHAGAAPPPVRSSFHAAMRLLPAPQRAAMFEIYAFCRAVDDIADSDALAPAKRAALEAWRADIRACCAGFPPQRLGALHGHIMAFGLACADFEAVIDGMLMDAQAEPLCAPPEAMLDLYCDRVASAVGRLSVKVFGMPRDDGLTLAYHLGRALQLTNILRDIDEDAAIGRLYLPREPLLGAGVGLDGGAGAIAAHPALPSVCALVAAWAQVHFDEARRVMRGYPSACVRTPRLMAAVYQALLTRLLARGWASPRAPVRIGKLARVGILLRHAVV
jgi:phytoene synthase